MRELQDAYVTSIQRLEAALIAMIDTFDAAVRNFEDRGKGGQQVSFCGDFASVGPSTVGQMRRWARDLRSAIRGEWPMTRDEYAKAFPSVDAQTVDAMFAHIADEAKRTMGTP